jgi:hypothetical protein
MNDELERIWREVVVALLRYYPTVCLEGPRKMVKNLRIASALVVIQTEHKSRSATATPAYTVQNFIA